MASSSSSLHNDSSNTIFLTENDITGASLLGRKPEELKTTELRFWLKCQGDSRNGLKTKAELVKRDTSTSELVKIRILSTMIRTKFTVVKKNERVLSLILAAKMLSWFSFPTIVNVLH